MADLQERIARRAEDGDVVGLLKAVGNLRISKRGPLWGPIWPYICGPTPEDFTYWATTVGDGGRRELDPTLKKLRHLKPLWRTFCEDCKPEYRRQMKSEDRCVYELLP